MRCYGRKKRNRNNKSRWYQHSGLWESLHNPDFNYLEFEAIKNEAGDNGFVMTPKRWIETTNAIGMTSKQGRYAVGFQEVGEEDGLVQLEITREEYLES